MTLIPIDPLIEAMGRAVALCQQLRRDRAPLQALAKADRSPATIADFSVQALLCRAIHEAFPDDAIVAEERSAPLRRPENRALLEGVLRHTRAALGDEGLSAATICDWIDETGGASGRRWALDPIDGTQGFLSGGQYAIALALLAEGAPQVALLACPALPHPAGEGLLLVARRGHGCTVHALDGTPLGRAHVSPQRELAQSRLAESVESGHSDHARSARLRRSLGIVAPPRRLESQAKYAVVALGEAELYLRLPRPGAPTYHEAIWDHAAGALSVEEAGGRVSDVEGRALAWTQGERLTANRGIVASNGLLHDAVVRALRAGDVSAFPTEPP